MMRSKQYKLWCNLQTKIINTPYIIYVKIDSSPTKVGEKTKFYFFQITAYQLFLRVHARFQIVCTIHKIISLFGKQEII